MEEKKRAAREVIDILQEISSLLVTMPILVEKIRISILM